MTGFLTIHRGEAPLIVAFPHGGTDLVGLEEAFVSPWLARKDADWHIAELYDFARALGATTIATSIARAVIDCNRAPDGASLYPGQATTELCPTTSFDGEPLYCIAPPRRDEIARRRTLYFEPYHRAIVGEIARLKARHGRVVFYDAHSIRSRVPRLFDGPLPRFNIGTNGGTTCASGLEDAVARLCAASGHGWVANGRFKGGWTTRHYGQPGEGVHAIQMELAMRAYLAEPDAPDSTNWPASLDPEHAGGTRQTLALILKACLAFAKESS